MIVDHFSDGLKIPAKKKHAAQLAKTVLRAFRDMRYMPQKQCILSENDVFLKHPARYCMQISKKCRLKIFSDGMII
ncbi:hypothetical protein PL75_05710 [Neisseria arctica]|uniref:Uncharacterized protein n=1 Tax=Neisseria arctica TaxID=1470200 RepID=A0A0J1C3V8_9NEIS|nr:hypothetical protein PL75_05710 [Neisseria arctica]